MTNPDPSFIAIRKQIFSHFDHNTLKVCQELFGERNGEDWNGDWDLWLEKRFMELLFHTDLNSNQEVPNRTYGDTLLWIVDRGYTPFIIAYVL